MNGRPTHLPPTAVGQSSCIHKVTRNRATKRSTEHTQAFPTSRTATSTRTRSTAHLLHSAGRAAEAGRRGVVGAVQHGARPPCPAGQTPCPAPPFLCSWATPQTTPQTPPQTPPQAPRWATPQATPQATRAGKYQGIYRYGSWPGHDQTDGRYQGSSPPGSSGPHPRADRESDVPPGRVIAWPLRRRDTGRASARSPVHPPRGRSRALLGDPADRLRGVAGRLAAGVTGGPSGSVVGGTFASLSGSTAAGVATGPTAFSAGAVSALVATRVQPVQAVRHLFPGGKRLQFHVRPGGSARPRRRPVRCSGCSRWAERVVAYRYQ
jgi:hypothetical protein